MFESTLSDEKYEEMLCKDSSIPQFLPREVADDLWARSVPHRSAVCELLASRGLEFGSARRKGWHIIVYIFAEGKLRRDGYMFRSVPFLRFPTKEELLTQSEFRNSTRPGDDVELATLLLHVSLAEVDWPIESELEGTVPDANTCRSSVCRGQKFPVGDRLYQVVYEFERCDIVLNEQPLFPAS